jgi:hypothetical protein
VIDGLGGVHPGLEAVFDAVYAQRDSINLERGAFPRELR